MSDEEINQAIAEECGWTRYVLGHSGGWLYRKQFGNSDMTLHATNLPKFCSDLNAIHEAEKTLDARQQLLYARHLHELFNNQRHCLHVDFDCIHTTARQRTEAFLRTIGKWRTE